MGMGGLVFGIKDLPNEHYSLLGRRGYWSASRAELLNQHSVLRNYVGPIFWNVGGDNVYSNGQLVDAADWRCQSQGIAASTCAAGYYKKIIANYNRNSGSLVLMHDIHNVTVNLLPILLNSLRDSGINWEFVFVQDIPAVKLMVTET